VLLSGKLTMGAHVSRFESELAAYLGVPCAVMVNSGSSANLIAVAGALELSKMGGLGAGVSGLHPGDEVLVPALAWSTTLAPLVQLGLLPVLVDIDVNTLNMDVAAAEAKVTGKTRAIMLVHAMGNSADMGAMMALAAQHSLVVIEDTCESLGSRHRGKLLGTQGHFGAYSFYYSHHITSGEGGAVVSSIRDDGTVCQTLRSLRAHGWTREFSAARKAAVEAKYPDIDSRFLFVHWGYNVRPMETQAAMASVQLVRLESLNRNRRANFYTMKATLASLHGVLALPKASPDVDPAWFGLILVLAAPYGHQRAALFEHLARQGVETRPVISGNFARQPVCHPEPEIWACGRGSSPAADVIHSRGLYIGLPSASVLTPEESAALTTAIVSFNFSKRHTTLVTGATGLVGSALQSVVASFPRDGRESFVFVNHSHVDLRDAHATIGLLATVRPTRIIHLAARIAPMAEMRKAPGKFFRENVDIDSNVLKAAAWLVRSNLLGSGTDILRVVSCLSTAMLPENMGIDSPVNETTLAELLAMGSGAGMQGYAGAKWKQLQLSTDLSRDTPGLVATTLMPSNIFGPGAKCASSGPLLNALVAKALMAKAGGPAMVVAGTGTPRRHMLYSEDLARVLLWAVDGHYQAGVPLIVAGEEYSVQQLAQLAARAVGYRGALTTDPSLPDGPPRRAVSTVQLSHLMPGLRWTPINEALAATTRACRAAAE